jgi:hypothetical protein
MGDIKACPNCDNVGWYVVQNVHTGEPEQQQCRFCYTEPDSVFNVVAALRARIEELTIPADVLDTAIEALSTWNTQYPERYLAARYWLQAQKAKATRPEGGKE